MPAPQSWWTSIRPRWRRGRNDRSIDRARTTAIEITVAEAIGESFDRDTFRAAYGTINVAKYHPFTADNQDYLAYICLMISAGFTTTEKLLADVDAGRVTNFRDFIEQVEAGRDRLPSDALRALHADIYDLVVRATRPRSRRSAAESIARRSAAWGICPTTRRSPSGWWKRCV